MSLYLYEEREYLSGKVDKPTSKTFLGISSCEFKRSVKRSLCVVRGFNLFRSLATANVYFSMTSLGCGLFGTFSSLLVFIGLRKDQREFLVPWILVMSLDIFIAVLHVVVVVLFGSLKFDPLTGTLFTVDFFVICLNVRS